MKKKIVVIIGLIIGLSVLALSTIQPISDINEDVIIVNNENLEIFYFNNLDPENPYNQDFSILSDKQINIRLSEINDFFEINKSQYIEPETISFSHIFFDTEEQAKSYLLKLEKVADIKKLKNLINTGGIVFPYQKNYSKKPFSFVVGHFGEIGAQNIFSLQKDIKNWQGPIRSSLGYHLINVFNKTSMKQMALDDILSEVKRDYYDQLRKKDTKVIISNKILEYQIIDETKVN